MTAWIQMVEEDYYQECPTRLTAPEFHFQATSAVRGIDVSRHCWMEERHASDGAMMPTRQGSRRMVSSFFVVFGSAICVNE
jgi:hypothetical protein